MNKTQIVALLQRARKVGMTRRQIASLTDQATSTLHSHSKGGFGKYVYPSSIDGYERLQKHLETYHPVLDGSPYKQKEADEVRGEVELVEKIVVQQEAPDIESTLIQKVKKLERKVETQERCNDIFSKAICDLSGKLHGLDQLLHKLLTLFGFIVLWIVLATVALFVISFGYLI